MIRMEEAQPAPAPRRPQDGWAALAVLLSLFFMVLPLEADMLDLLIRRGRFVYAGVVATIFFAVVACSFLVSLSRCRREPDDRRGRGYLIAAGVILCLMNLCLVTATMIFAASKASRTARPPGAGASHQLVAPRPE